MRRIVTMVVTSLLAAAMVLYVQKRFEKADEHNALVIVQTYRSQTGNTIPDALSRRYPGRTVQWSTATQSSCFQHLRAHAVVSEKAASEPVIYAFAVDLNGPSIHPANKPGEELLADLDKPLPAAASASATAAASASATVAGSASAAAAASASAGGPP